MEAHEAGGQDLTQFGEAVGRWEVVKPGAYWAFHEGRGSASGGGASDWKSQFLRRNGTKHRPHLAKYLPPVLCPALFCSLELGDDHPPMPERTGK